MDVVHYAMYSASERSIRLITFSVSAECSVPSPAQKPIQPSLTLCRTLHRNFR